MKRATWILALALTAGRSASGQDLPAASVLPSWLDVDGEYRIRVEGIAGARFQSENDDAWVLSRLRLGATFLPSKKWRAVVQVQDAHVFFKDQQPARPPFQDVLDARLAFVEVGARSADGVRARIGRQEMAFGEQRLIGNADWLNTARTFDAARVTLTRPHVTIDGFGGYVVRVVPAQLNIPEPGTMLFGLHAVIRDAAPHGTIEPYIFARRTPNQLTETTGRDALHSATIGARWTATAPKSVDIGVEVAGQVGSIGSDRVRAWAGHWSAGVTKAQSPWKPRAFVEYNYASGDDNARDGRRQTFDQLYATGHDKYGLADQIGWRNVHDLRIGSDLKPSRRLLATVRYHSWWIASTADAVYDASGAVLTTAPAMVASRHIGQEVDAQAIFSLPRLRVGAGYARIFPGALLEAAIRAKPLSYPYVSLTVGL